MVWLSIREQRVPGAVSGAVRVLLVQAHCISPFLREQPLDETADSSAVIYVIFAFRLTLDLRGEAPFGPVEARFSVEFSEKIVNHNRSGDGQIEGRHQAPLWNLNHQFGLFEQFVGHASELGAEQEARPIRILGIEEVDRPIIELHGNEVPVLPAKVVAEFSSAGNLGDSRIQLGGTGRLDIPLTLANQQHFFGRHCVRGAHQRADVVLLGDVPGRNRHRPQATTVLGAPSFTACEAALHGESVFEVGHVGMSLARVDRVVNRTNITAESMKGLRT